MKSKVSRHVHQQRRVDKLKQQIEKLKNEKRILQWQLERSEYELERLKYKDAFDIIDKYDEMKAKQSIEEAKNIKKALIPGYGKKGMGWINNPKKAAYNKAYNKTTFSWFDLFK